MDADTNIASKLLPCNIWQRHRSSPTIELLTCLAWGLLLRRVGDGIMVYLLKYTSIFLPLPRKQHYQVRSGKKRKRIDEVDLMSDKEQSNSAFGDIVPSSLVGCFGCNGTSYSTSFSRNCGIKSHQESLSGEATLCTGTDNANTEGNTNGEHQECSNQITAKSRKRLRQFSWQRHRKRRQLDIQETYSSTQCTKTMSDRERPSERPQSGLNTSMPLQCSCCLVLQTLQRVTREAGIDKQFMFYKLECSSSVFPRKLFYTDQNTEGRVCSIFEGNKFQTNSLGKRHAKVLQQGKLPLDECSSLETDLGKRTPETRTSPDFVLKHTKVQSADMPRKCSQVNNVADAMKHEIVEKWIFWLFSCLVVPLLQANFYVTESERGKQDVFYFRKSIWKKVMNLNDQNYRPLNDASVRNIIGKRSFGFSRVRLRPKGNGVRVLANLKASSRMPVKEHSLKVLSCGLLGKLSLHPRHVKYDTFKSVNNVLPRLISIRLHDDVYRKLCPFLSVLKNGSTTVPSVFIVVCDVSKAFDSVNQDKLLSVMKDVIENDECLLKLSHQVVCTKKSLWVRQNIILADQDISIGSTKFTSASYHSLHGILVNQGWSRKIRKEELYFNLNEHVKQNVLQLDKKYYLQHNLLLDIYQRHDDYDASAEAARFFSRLQRGFREYNCYMNQEKCGLNFDIDQKSGITSNRVHMGDDGITFLRWCGLFINCCTLEVQADYTRYLNTHLSSTLTVCWQGKPGHHSKAKLCDHLRPKCHPIFYDSNINSAVVVRLNIYQAFLLCGMKFHCYVYDLSNICRLSAKSYMGIIEGSFRAYIQVLKRKQSRYKEVLSLLRSRLIAQATAKCVSSILKDAVDDSRSPVMWKIMY
ncbi:unnamed protein product [Camellia sinensis]